MIILQTNIDEFLIKVQKGINIPIVATSSILNGKLIIENVEYSELKSKILSYLEGHKKSYISDIVIALNAEPSKVINALKKLREEGRVIECD